MYHAQDIVNFILKETYKEGLSNLRLQKLLFFLQMNFLKEKDLPLFIEEIEIWDFGPVIPIIYEKYIQFGANSIHLRKEEKIFEDKIDNEDKKEILKIIKKLQEFSTIELTKISCKIKIPNGFFRIADKEDLLNISKKIDLDKLEFYIK